MLTHWKSHDIFSYMIELSVLFFPVMVLGNRGVFGIRLGFKSVHCFIGLSHFFGTFYQVALHGSGVASSSSLGGYYHVGSYQNPSSTPSYYGVDNRVRLTPDIGKRREKDQGSISSTSDLYGNRGPRASSRVKSKNSSKPCSTIGDSASDSSTAGPNPSLYNHPEFVTDYKNAKFFIVKSFSEDNVHRSIKYNVWASTPHGNKKLDTAYRDAEKMGGKCPIFLFFSVWLFHCPISLFSFCMVFFRCSSIYNSWE